jgi:hypothetical protein
MFYLPSSFQITGCKIKPFRGLGNTGPSTGISALDKLMALSLRPGSQAELMGLHLFSPWVNKFF